MKKTNKLLIGFTAIAALIVGFLIGISVEYPRLNSDKLSGTIGKVKNYRNIKVSEEDIQLKNEIVEDSLLKKSLTNYFSFHYSKTVDLGNNINLAIKKASDDKSFMAEFEPRVNSLKKYASFLETTRKNLLLGITGLQNAEEINPIDLKMIIAKAQNIIVQSNYKNQDILDFIDNVDEFIMANGTENHKGITEAHDLLMLKQINHAIWTKDKMVIKFLDKKKIYNNIEPEQLAWSLHNAIAFDMESLKSVLDAEKLGLYDAEKLGSFLCDNKELSFLITFDSESLGCWDSENLGILYNDTDNLGVTIGMLNAEKLGRVAMDKENLGWHDNEKLGFVADAENLGVCHWDSEKLKMFIDSELLGLYIGQF